jgi:hypothetical protein
MKALIIGFITSAFCIGADAQISKTDTILYLYFDEHVHLKIEHKPKYHSIEKKIVDPENLYSFKGEYYLYGGHPIDFYTVNKVNARSINKSELKKINVATIDQLKSFLKENYTERKPEAYLPLDPLSYGSFGPDPQGSASYWNQLKHIYFVEKDDSKKNKYVITEVRLEVIIQ